MQRKGQKNEITPPDNSEWARERNPTQGVLWVRFIILSLRDFSRLAGYERVRNKQTCEIYKHTQICTLLEPLNNMQTKSLRSRTRLPPSPR